MLFRKKISLLAMACALSAVVPVAFSADGPKASGKTAVTDVKPWMDKALNAEQRTDLVLKEMTLDEKLTLVYGYFGTDAPQLNSKRPKESINLSAGYIYGIPRLGIPAQFQTDAGLGVACQAGEGTLRERTGLASGLNTTASWDLDVAYNGGAMIGSEARSSGFNVMLAGGVNLMREPRNGRNFEYGGEDPLLAGHIVGQQIKGIQANNIISTLKHFAFNDQEQGRSIVNALVEDSAARMSDLLALQIANEVGKPGSVMCSYNLVNGFYACENQYLLNEVLKGDWAFKGYVMSDWGAVHSTIPAANNGLDQQSAYSFDKSPYFGMALKEAVEQNWVPLARLDNMARRILWAMFDKGLFDHPVKEGGTIDFAAHALVTQTGSEQGMVLLKNSNNILPLTKSLKKIAVIGSHSDVGVLSGGGSSKVFPIGGIAVKGLMPDLWPGPVIYFPSSPLKAIKARVPESQVLYAEGTDVKAAAKLAAESDLVVLFVNQWLGEAFDAQTLSLPDNQDALVAAIAKANPKTVIVLQNGGPVLMPWLDSVSGVLEAWYPGTSGGEAIARVLFGEVNPSGHLPATFPASEKQLPRPILDGDSKGGLAKFDVNYFEGAAVGYKWYELKGLKPLFPFGYGLSYTQFSYSNLTAEVKEGVLNVNFKMTNTGKVKGKDVAQVYVSPVKGSWEAPKRLGGWSKVELNPGESKNVSVTVEPRVLSMYQSAAKTWTIVEGDYKVILAQDSADANATSVIVHLNASTLNSLGKKVN
ncbi:MAG: glycoside hydrolase family 3 C-terminal domain-containing protein [Pseudomonadota bacterium]